MNIKEKKRSCAQYYHKTQNITSNIKIISNKMTCQKNWCFTLNNYTEEEYEKTKTIECAYIVLGKEVGESGTPHIQGFVVFHANKRLAACKKLIPRAHWEAARGSSEQAAAYCKKDNNFEEIGDPPKTKRELGQDEQERWKKIKEFAQSGKLDEIDAKTYVIHYNTLKKIASDHMKKPDDLQEVCGHYYWGEAGTGKTTSARLEHPGAYIKSRDKWWDGYQGEEVVILDDLDKYHVALAGYLKDWADKWTFKAETKGGYIWIRPKKFIITSQYHYQEIWTDKETLEALDRRYTEKKFLKKPFDKQ